MHVHDFSATVYSNLPGILLNWPSMFPRPPPPPLEPKPTLPLPFTGYNVAPDETQRLLALAARDDGTSLKSYAGFYELLLAAIDPVTGDSPLHRAAAAGNHASMVSMVYCFGKQLSHVPRTERLLWVLWTHQNSAGDTALHAAASAGSLKGVKSVYRLFWRDSHDPDDDDMCNPDSPAESWEWDGNEGAALPALAFLCTKNRAGRDAAAETRATGHDDIAFWLERVAERLVPAGQKVDEDYLRRARQAALDTHRYFDGGTHG
ncbi:hypothetical protein DL546_005957 [Coniochaeta pulveracea]|uniref:Uncharacterized protein n=1 Tax=Coniochaeta pulveracea TaxID=177199 RepID=A0A420Y6C5_9PEZI|nr:hypothetical protein DL546_005957 [Coniochaeta pulveracea]